MREVLADEARDEVVAMVVPGTASDLDRMIDCAAGLFHALGHQLVCEEAIRLSLVD